MLVQQRVSSAAPLRRPSHLLLPTGARPAAGRWQQQRRQLQRCRAGGDSAAAALLILGFLPWSGCSTGGFYDTGIQGVAGKDCQAVYQPAAAAESRFATALLQKAAARAAAAAAPAASDALSQPAAPSAAAAQEAGEEQQQQLLQAGTHSSGQSASQLVAEGVPDAAKALIRDILHEDNKQRTKELVDAAWQSLE